MGKNIILCCDGTDNEFGNRNTNVVKLYSVLDHGRPDQISYYHPGLGSMGSPYAMDVFTNAWSKWFGLAFGYGISAHLGDLYGYLMEHMHSDDKLYVFGFSRGAYTARALCSMLRAFGVVRCHDTSLIPYGIRLMKSYGSGNNRDVVKRFRETFSAIEVKPHFVGVWDTVSSVGGIYSPLKLPFTAENPDIVTGRHAISVDERRAFFRTNLWHPAEGQDIQQVWFPGVHSDVGGGYPEKESGLAKIALEWMLCEAQKAGLHVCPEKVRQILCREGGSYAKPDPTAMLHNSMKGWLWAEVIPRYSYSPVTRQRHVRWPLAKRRFIANESCVHESVFQRRDGMADYRPGNVGEMKQYRVVKTSECFVAGAS